MRQLFDGKRINNQRTSWKERTEYILICFFSALLCTLWYTRGKLSRSEMILRG